MDLVTRTMPSRMESLHERLDSPSLRPILIGIIILSLISIIPILFASYGWLLWAFTLPAIGSGLVLANAEFKKYHSLLPPALLLSPLVIPAIIFLIGMFLSAPHHPEGVDPHAAYRNGIISLFYALFFVQFLWTALCVVLYPERKWIAAINSLFALVAHCLISFFAGMSLTGNWF